MTVPDKTRVVQKFGGTSVGSLELIGRVADLVKASGGAQQNVVVVSAMAGQTNQLVAMAREISKNPDGTAYDMLLASGEQVSCALLALALTERGVPAVPLLGFQVGIETDDLFMKAHIQQIRTEVLEAYLSRGITPVIAGFQGVFRPTSGESYITTLGRGGSDTSAVAIAAALKADRCDIFTDVDGVYTADPRHVPTARRIREITFSEMMELASLGAKVLHMRSVELAAKFELPLRVLSTFAPERGGTNVVKENFMLESPVVSAVTTDSAECLLALRVPAKDAAYPAKFFRPLADAGINVDVIVQTPPDQQNLSTISFTVPREEGLKAEKLLVKYQARIQRESTVKLSIVGIGMRTHSGVAAQMFEALEKAQIGVHLITTSEIKVSVLIDEARREEALRLLHELFALGVEK